MLSHEVLAPVLEGERRLGPQRGAAGEPLHLVILQESEAPPLPFLLLPEVLHLLLQRQGLLPELLESLLDELPDLAARDSEDLAQRGVAGVRGVLAVRDDAAVLDDEDIVDLAL